MTGAWARRFQVEILLIILLAFGLRLAAIDRQDIWGDEAFSIWLSRQPLPQVVAGGADTHPPLYPFLLYLWLRLAGSSPLAVRTLSALIGTLTVAVVYLLGCRVPPPLSREQGGGRGEGRLATGIKPRRGRLEIAPGSRRYCLRLPGRPPARTEASTCVDAWPQAPEVRLESLNMGKLAALLAAVSPVLVYYSQETRMYGLVTLLAAASVYQAVRCGQGSLWPYMFITLAAVYTHYYAFFVLLAENLIIVPSLFRRCRPALRRWLIAQGAILLAYLPWIVVQTGFLSGKASARFAEWDLSTAWRIIRDTLIALSAGLSVRPAIAQGIAALFLIALFTGLVAALSPASAEGSPSAPGRRSERRLIVACLLLPLFLAWAVNPVMPFFYARYLLLLAPAFYLLVAWGVGAWGRLWPPLYVGGVALLLAGSGWGLYGYYTDDAYLKGRYGQMMAYVQAQARPGDALILANPLQRPLFEYYRPEGLEAYFFPRYGVPLEDPRTAAELERIAARHPRLWLVRFGNPAEYDPAGTLIRWLATHGGKAYFGGWVDADLSLYVMPPAVVGQGIQHPLRLDLGGQVRLLGYALNTERLAPGETLLLTLYWQALAPMDKRYTVFTHLLDKNNQIQAQMDSEPQGGSLPTDRWTVGQVIQDNYALTLSARAIPGPYLLEVGLYLLASGERLPVHDADSGAALGDRVVLNTIEVVGP